MATKDAHWLILTAVLGLGGAPGLEARIGALRDACGPLASVTPSMIGTSGGGMKAPPYFLSSPKKPSECGSDVARPLELSRWVDKKRTARSDELGPVARRTIREEIMLSGGKEEIGS